MRIAIRSSLLLVLFALLAGCGYNTIQQKEQAVKAAWSRCSISTSAAPT